MKFDHHYKFYIKFSIANGASRTSLSQPTDWILNSKCTYPMTDKKVVHIQIWEMLQCHRLFLTINIVRTGSFIIHAIELRLMMAAHGVSGATTDLADVDLVEMFNLNASEIILDGHAGTYFMFLSVSAIIRQFVHWLTTTRHNVSWKHNCSLCNHGQSISESIKGRKWA